jgi:hypothetical protein
MQYAPTKDTEGVCNTPLRMPHDPPRRAHGHRNGLATDGTTADRQRWLPRPGHWQPAPKRRRRGCEPSSEWVGAYCIRPRLDTGVYNTPLPPRHWAQQREIAALLCGSPALRCQGTGQRLRRSQLRALADRGRRLEVGTGDRRIGAKASMSFRRDQAKGERADPKADPLWVELLASLRALGYGCVQGSGRSRSPLARASSSPAMAA